MILTPAPFKFYKHAKTCIHAQKQHSHLRIIHGQVEVFQRVFDIKLTLKPAERCFGRCIAVIFESEYTPETEQHAEIETKLQLPQYVIVSLMLFNGFVVFNWNSKQLKETWKKEVVLQKKTIKNHIVHKYENINKQYCS